MSASTREPGFLMRFALARFYDLLVKLPFFLLYWVGFIYCWDFISSDKTANWDQYKVLLSGIALTGTVCGLTFRASSSAKDLETKDTYYEVGESLLLALLQMIGAIVTTYCFHSTIARFEAGLIRLIALTGLAVISVILAGSSLIIIRDGLSTLFEVLFRRTAQHTTVANLQARRNAPEYPFEASSENPLCSIAAMKYFRRYFIWALGIGIFMLTMLSVRDMHLRRDDSTPPSTQPTTQAVSFETREVSTR